MKIYFTYTASYEIAGLDVNINVSKSDFRFQVGDKISLIYYYNNEELSLVCTVSSVSFSLYVADEDLCQFVYLSYDKNSNAALALSTLYSLSQEPLNAVIPLVGGPRP